MMNGESERPKEILGALKLSFSVPRLQNAVDDPFKVLVRTIISQSTTEANTKKAYTNLSSKLAVTPKGLAQANATAIEELLKVAGLYRNKARVLKKVSELILERFNGSLAFMYSSPLGEARKKLMSLPGVGPKTADIVLLFCAGKPVLPVDTHVNRVSKRLGLAPPRAGYEKVRGSLESVYPPEEYFNVHVLFIALGRKYCTAIKPLHASCPVRNLCPSASA